MRKTNKEKLIKLCTVYQKYLSLEYEYFRLFKEEIVETRIKMSKIFDRTKTRYSLKTDRMEIYENKINGKLILTVKEKELKR